MVNEQVVALVAEPPKLVVVITPVDEFKEQFACAALVKTLVTSEYTIVSPVAATVATVPLNPPAIVPREPALVVHAGASEIVRTAVEDLTASPSVFSIQM